MTDPIADMLTRIRNAAKVHHEMLEVPYSRMKFALAKILVQEGYLTRAESTGEGVGRTIQMELKYRSEHESHIRGLRRISKPGRRMYVGVSGIPRVNSGQGLAILSTSQGLLSDKDARAKGIGGEILCEIF